MADATNMLKELGEPLVKAAFEDLLSSRIPSKKAEIMLRKFSRSWKDYGRAALMVLSCRAVGGDPSLVSPAAKALILTGGGFDLHDDIIDSSYTRFDTKRKTTMGMYGRESTLLAGDALIIVGLSELHDLDGLSKDKFREVLSVIKDGLLELGSAEMDELALIQNLDATPRMYLRIVNMKAADVESYTRIGGIIGNGSKEEVDALGRFGRLLGMITILRDDIEDTFNDKAELSSRILKESLPLPMVYSLSSSDCKAKLQNMFGGINDGDLDEIVAIVEANKGFEKTKNEIERCIEEAKSEAMKLKKSQLLLSLFQ